MPPPINQALVASVGIAAATVVVAAAVAIYQDPEVRRRTDELRRRIAIALRSLGDGLDPNRNSQPRFNRPEDAHGFYESHTVDADEETRRRQREELLYWNALRESQHSERQPSSPHGSTFDDFLKPDSTGDRGTFVYNTGANVWDDSNNIRRRGGNAEGVRGLNAGMVSNPFSDEMGIELDEQPRSEEANLLAPGQDEIMSDVYNATPRLNAATPVQQPVPITPLSNPAVPNVLFDFESESQTVDDSHTEYDTVADVEQNSNGRQTPTDARSSTLERELAEDEYMTASGDDDEEDERTAAYASIQAWAQNSTNNGFYSPLPVTPTAPMSEAEFISEGHLTPTDSVSVVDVGYDAASSRGGDYDVLSDSDEGIATPGSWSEVGSVISESESAVRA